MTDVFDTIVVGTGFASSFFLHRYLGSAPPESRVLVLEAGPRRSHATQLEIGLQKDGAKMLAEAGRHFDNLTPQKPWVFTLGFGGGSNCWWGNTPRMLPSDFQLHANYGVGSDWPLSYAELEPHYCDAEELMEIAGPGRDGPAPRSRPYPQPPHRMTEPDRKLSAHHSGSFFPMPTARARELTRSGRPPCCVNAVCRLCPIDSKFTITNSLASIYDDPRVQLRLGCSVKALESGGAQVDAVRFVHDGKAERASAGQVVLGANPIFNAHILLRSGLAEGGVGQGLVEQVSRSVVVKLDGLDNFQGSTSHTAHGYLFYDGPHRREQGGALIETSNVPTLRNERGKWRQLFQMKFICEDLRQASNRVELSAGDPDRPTVRFEGHSDYAQRALDAVPAQAEKVLQALPVESFEVTEPHPGEAHILGTTVMGRDPERSVVDADSVHHRLRNLRVLGGSTFPTAAPANPTLTIAALALRSADALAAARPVVERAGPEPQTGPPEDVAP